MGLLKRVSQVFQQKSNALLNKVEDPTQALDLSYQKMLENLQQVRKSIADVLTSQKRLEAQRAQLQAQYDKLQGQARQAVQQGQEQVARLALERASTIKPQIDQLTPQIEQLAKQEAALEETGRQLNAKIEAFRAQRDTMKAQYTAAKASTAALEGLTGLSDQMTDVTMMMDRAKDKISEMQARSAAVGELADSGVLDSPALGGGGDDIEAALAAGNQGNDVDLQLAQIKAELAAPADQTNAIGAPPAPAAIAASEPAQATTPPAPATPPAPGTSAATVAVRILSDHVYLVPASLRPALDGLDDALDQALDHDDADGFTRLLAQVIELVRTNGTPTDDPAVTAEVVVPAPDTTLDEAKALVSDDANQDASTND
ncbi:phage shock protein A, PspA [Acidimicrobium ferrooxidans DSM 10331]|uniref:Phage shock protein A, PspA n=1 Tax=Acidimicrobium ferrooxidans (strain DSM 10331 / JCM 15462 / NBRC 103882 / ICP) TaxID=525909 RepID=C7LYT6_ACIFD|nr:PspA/IM30 family protein [Acidimicrobium ferrooxidans]ACU53894.1 phage shock protein A, PspA [Acidimicrobium ferrooxidans DSM 10331]